MKVEFEGEGPHRVRFASRAGKRHAGRASQRWARGACRSTLGTRGVLRLFPY